MTYSTLLLSPLLPIKIAHYTFLEGTFLNFLVSKPQLREMVENHMEVQKEKARITMEVCRLTVDTVSRCQLWTSSDFGGRRAGRRRGSWRSQCGRHVAQGAGESIWWSWELSFCPLGRSQAFCVLLLSLTLFSNLNSSRDYSIATDPHLEYSGIPQSRYKK